MLYAVLSTVSAQLNTQNECSDKKRKSINFATQNRAKAKRKCFFQWQDHNKNEPKFRFATFFERKLSEIYFEKAKRILLNSESEI